MPRLVKVSFLLFRFLAGQTASWAKNNFFFSKNNFVGLTQETKRKLFHSSVYESEAQLKRLYVQTCQRLPAFNCLLFHVREIVSNLHTKKKVINTIAQLIDFPFLFRRATATFTTRERQEETYVGTGKVVWLCEFRHAQDDTSTFCKTDCWDLFRAKHPPTTDQTRPFFLARLFFFFLLLCVLARNLFRRV